MSPNASEAEDYVSAYRRDGYAIIKGFFSAEEVARISGAADQIHAEGIEHGRSFRHGNLFYNVAPGDDGQPVVRMIQWPSYHQPVLNAVRLDPRFARLLEPLIGGDMKQIINQIHWKAPGSMGDFAWHQDSRFRLPTEAYRNLGSAYVQTGLALDEHRPESGCLRFIQGSHHGGDLQFDDYPEVLGRAMDDEILQSRGLSSDDVVEVLLDAGDLALWSPYLVHGSGQNRSTHKRRLYINGYVRAADCDRGEWAFKDGQPVKLGTEPALVHYEELREDPDPHYV